MTYVVTGLCGDLEAYKALMSAIAPKGTDNVFLLGNIIDGGTGGIDILMDAVYRENVFPVAGTRELMAIKYLPLMANPSEAPDMSLKQGMAEWLASGGMTTASAFSKLDEDSKEDILSYIESEFTLVEELEINGKPTYLAFSGLGNYSPEKLIDEYTEDDLTDGDFDPDSPDISPAIRVVCGENLNFTPPVKFKNKIFIGDSSIVLSHAYMDSPCAIRLEDLEEYYI